MLGNNWEFVGGGREGGAGGGGGGGYSQSAGQGSGQGGGQAGGWGNQGSGSQAPASGGGPDYYDAGDDTPF